MMIINLSNILLFLGLLQLKGNKQAEKGLPLGTGLIIRKLNSAHYVTLTFLNQSLIVRLWGRELGFA
jgi:hypothetical protein